MLQHMFLQGDVYIGCALDLSEGMGPYIHNFTMTHDKGNNYVALMGCDIGPVGKSACWESMRTRVRRIPANHVKVWA